MDEDGEHLLLETIERHGLPMKAEHGDVRAELSGGHGDHLQLRRREWALAALGDDESNDAV